MGVGMQPARQLMLVVAAALAFCALTVGLANALRSIQLTESRSRDSARAVTFMSPESELFIACDLTLDLVFNSTSFSKTPGIVGSTTFIPSAGCSSGDISVLAGPRAGGAYNLKYVGFAGTLPNITSVTFQIEQVRLLIEDIFVRCLYTGELRKIASGNPATTLRFDDRDVFRLSVELTFFCPRQGGIRGTATLSPSMGFRLI